MVLKVPIKKRKQNIHVSIYYVQSQNLRCCFPRLQHKMLHDHFLHSELLRWKYKIKKCIPRKDILGVKTWHCVLSWIVQIDMLTDTCVMCTMYILWHTPCHSCHAHASHFKIILSCLESLEMHFRCRRKKYQFFSSKYLCIFANVFVILFILRQLFFTFYLNLSYIALILVYN